MKVVGKDARVRRRIVAVINVMIIVVIFMELYLWRTWLERLDRMVRDREKALTLLA